MNKRLKFLLLLTCIVCISAEAQQKPRKGKKKVVEAPPPEQLPIVEEAPIVPPVDIFTVLLDSMKKEDSAVVASGYDPLSVRKIHVSDIMYRMQIWRVLDLREKCNQPFFAKDNQITKAMIEEVYAGRLNAYSKDSLTHLMNIDEFKDKIVDPASSQVDVDGNPIPNTGQAFMPSQLYVLKFRENLVFDKQRSRFYYDIQTVTLFVPAEFNTLKGTETEVATFKYKDLVKLFRNMPTAKWYNSQNRAEDKKIADAMDLRLFCSRIIKISNPKDAMIEDLPEYNTSNKAILIASQKYEYDLVAKENEVWDY